MGSVERFAMSGLMWNIALDGNGNPKLPGTDSCGTGCRAVATVNGDGSYSLNQECESVLSIRPLWDCADSRDE